MESRSYVCVQLDIHVLLVSDLLVADLDLLVDPIGELVLEDRGHDIADPLAADLVDLQPIRHVVLDVVGLCPAELGDLLQRELLVVRH